MKAFISAAKDGNSGIELVDDAGFHLDTIEVTEIHVETHQENIEPLARVHRRVLESGRFYAN